MVYLAVAFVGVTAGVAIGLSFAAFVVRSRK
jgi:hypothetical protein